MVNEPHVSVKRFLSRRSLPMFRGVCYHHQWPRLLMIVNPSAGEPLLHGALYDELDSFVVITLYLRVRHAAVALGRGDVRMPEKVLDGRDIRIGIEELRGHRVAQTVTGDFNLTLPCIVFDTFLDTSH